MSPAASLPRLALVAIGLVCLAGGASLAAGQGVVTDEPQPAIESPANTSGYLQPASDETRRAYVHHDVDVGVAVSDRVADLGARLDRRTFERDLSQDDSRSERLATIREYVTQLESRTTAVQSAQRQARQAFLADDLSRTAFLEELARIDARAASLEQLRSRIEERVTRLSPQPDSALTTVQNLEAALETVGGPATRSVRNRFAGNVSAGATYVSVVGGHGLVVATVSGDQLYREALDETERNPDGSDRFAVDGEPEISVALRRAAELYPWAFENGGAAEPLRGYGDTTVYRITAEHIHGRLSAYLDGATENVFREIQRTRLRMVPVTDQAEERSAGLHLAVNATHSTGPLSVTVTQANSGNPADVRITVDGETVGYTGNDGQLWTVQSPGTTTVRAVTDGGNTVEVTVG